MAAVAQIRPVQKILEVLCGTTGMGFAAVARVTESRWIACAVRDEIDFGLKPGGELKVETTICHEIRQSQSLVVIDCVADDPQFCGHHTPRMYGFQSYISVPIVLSGGEFFGTLCAIDPRPAKIRTPETIGMVRLFADLIAMHLDAQERTRANEAALLDAQESAQLRDQFIAVLGHDLRNPLAAIDSSAEVLRVLPHAPESDEVLDMIQRSVDRMAGLIDNVLDFARGRLGGGLPVHCIEDEGVEGVLGQVVGELRSAWPSREIYSDLRVPAAIYCDSSRLAQMLSNLLANALTHGDPREPVWVRARADAQSLVISVTNRGEPIPPQTQERLFHPFSKGSPKDGKQGLGLGLYIASEIARAHGGSLSVASTRQETRFTFKMPCRRSP